MHERNSVSSIRIVVKGFRTSKETTSMKNKPHPLCVVELTAVVLMEVSCTVEYEFVSIVKNLLLSFLGLL